MARCGWMCGQAGQKTRLVSAGGVWVDPLIAKDYDRDEWGT